MSVLTSKLNTIEYDLRHIRISTVGTNRYILVYDCKYPAVVSGKKGTLKDQLVIPQRTLDMATLN